MRFRFAVAVVLLTLCAAGRIAARQQILRDQQVTAALSEQNETARRDLDTVQLDVALKARPADLLPERATR